MNRLFLAIAFLVFLVPQSYAYIFPEHRQIALLAVQNLSPEYRKLLDNIWSNARKGYESRLTEYVIDPAQTIKPEQLDWASWTAIAGDHSCSPVSLLNTVLHSDWILKVAGIGAKLSLDLAKAKNRSYHVNALSASDIKLLRADQEYATRAGSNNVHFLYARQKVDIEATDYLTACYTKGTELNAMGVYTWFHKSALIKATRYAQENLSEAEKSTLLLSALADEAFGLHFLEDVYAAGHIAGTWGNASLRKGTHDFYNEKGIEADTWDGSKAVRMGDSYMRKEDAIAAAASVQKSLEALIDATNGNLKVEMDAYGKALGNQPDSFDVCKNNLMPERGFNYNIYKNILIRTPIPGLGSGIGEVTRYRAEIGPFIGISSSLNADGISGGFGGQQKTPGSVGGLEANIRIGYGVDGVLSQAGDGLFFLQFGWREDAATSNSFSNTDIAASPVSITSAIPGRSAINLRFRMPFWLIPGDLILAAPIFLFSPATYTKMAVSAANGGLIPWQSGIATRIGRFQFTLGREIGLSFYGLGNPKDVIILPVTSAKSLLVEFKSTKIDFPILEYRPFKTFSTNQSSNILFQFSAGIDMIRQPQVLLPVGEPMIEMKNIWYIGFRAMFNWRHYF
ncbi:MAG: hypothetical protein RLZZ28_857 [Bacteroidota bacterium]